MKNNFKKLVLALLIALALVAGSLPRSVRAATCASYYTVQEGDTTPKISQTFGLKWREIADANDLERAWKPVPGTYLCIPTAESVESGTSGTSVSTTGSIPGDSNASFSAQVAGKKLTITGADFKKKQVYYVKVRDASQNSGGWVKVGTFTIPKDTTKSQSYQLPDAFRNKPAINVCLKDAYTDDLICRTVVSSP